MVDQILRADPTAAPADGRADAAGTGAVLAAALGRLAADGPLAVVVDDAHWADLASLRALTFAIRRLGDPPVVIAITCRTDGLDRMPPGLLARADATAGRVTLGPLDRAAIAELGERAYGRPLSAGQASVCTPTPAATPSTPSPCWTSCRSRSRRGGHRFRPPARTPRS